MICLFEPSDIHICCYSELDAAGGDKNYPIIKEFCKVLKEKTVPDNSDIKPL